jgi:hypothetical protein
MVNGRCLILILHAFISVFGQVYEIDLDLPANERYTEVSRIKK